jgi:hypothetical protein
MIISENVWIKDEKKKENKNKSKECAVSMERACRRDERKKNAREKKTWFD